MVWGALLFLLFSVDLTIRKEGTIICVNSLDGLFGSSIDIGSSCLP